MLQNEKYIEFANDNTVEVIALGDLPKAMADTKDKRTATYDAKDENGNPVKYMKEYAGMTSDQLIALDSSPAGQYNHTGHIPYASIVDPWTLQEVKSMPGGAAAGGFMEAALAAKKVLNDTHGPSVKRSTLAKVDAAMKAVDPTIAKDGIAKALADAQKLEAGVAKEPDSVKAKAKAVTDKVMEAAKAQLDDVEKKIAAGDLKGAQKALSTLAPALKGTELEARTKELLEKSKPAPSEPAK